MMTMAKNVIGDVGTGKRHSRREHEKVHSSLIEPMIGHHGRPIQKKKAPSCGTH